MSTNHIDRGQDGVDRKELRAKVDQLNKDAFENWHNPTWRNEMAQELTESIYWGFEHENLLDQITTVENAPFDGRVFVKETRGLRAFWVARGGYIEASTLHAEVMEIPRDTIGFHVTEFEDKLQTNFAETQASLQDLGVQRLDAEVNNRLLRLFQAAIPSSSPFYVATNTVNLTSLNHALRAVRDATLDVGNVSIIGRATMTDQIIDAITATNTYGGFLPQTNEDLFKQGVLGSYRGANIITLTNYKDGDDIPFFPANEMYVVARDASKFAFWGGLQSKEWDEQDNWYWHFLARRDFGGVVHRPERIRRIVDTNTAP
jgi:hypothetical protein